MKSAVIPQIQAEPELRAELESELSTGEILTVGISVKRTITEVGQQAPQLQKPA